MDALAQSQHRHAKNPIVVESQLWNLVEGKPLCLVGIVAALHFADFDEREIGNGDDAFARIAFRIGKRVELFEIGMFDARLSSRNSRSAPVSAVSSGCRNPPGKAQRPLKGSMPRRISSTFSFVTSKPKITQSVVTAGCGYS